MGPEISIQVGGMTYTAYIMSSEGNEESLEPEKKQTEIVCQVCKRKYKTAKSFETHNKIHKSQNIKIYKCTDCGKRYFGERRFQIHQMLHFDHRSVKCVICSCFLQNRRKFKLHLKAHPYQDYVDLGMSWDAVYESSISSSKVSQLVERCDTCGVNVPEKYMRHHQSVIHGDCRTKKKKLEHYRVLRKKVRPESKVGKQKIISLRKSIVIGCRMCYSYFRRRNALDKHMKALHNTVGCFRCSFCNKIFQTHCRWIAHNKFHSKTRPFQSTTYLGLFGLESHVTSHQISQQMSPPIADIDGGQMSQEYIMSLPDLAETDLKKEIFVEEKQLEVIEPSKEAAADKIVVITLSSDSECDSNATTVTATSDDERSLSDLEGEELLGENDCDTPSPNLGNQGSENLSDLQDQLDFQELTLAKHSFVSDNNNYSDIESGLTNGILYGDFSFLNDENETPDFEAFDEEQRRNENAKTLDNTGLSSLVTVNPYLIIPDLTVTTSSPLYEMCVRAGSDDEESQLSKQYKLSLISQKTQESLPDFQCPFCDKSFQTEVDADNHVLSHTLATFACNTCGETFEKRACLALHETSHIEVEASVDGESPGRLVRRRRKRPFKRRGVRCDSTPALVQTVDDKELMTLGSSGEFGKSTIRIDGLSSTATAVKDEEFICNYTFCGKKENSSTDCYYCGRRFQSQRNFWSHQATHFGEKPFHCNICVAGIRFRELSAFHAHINDEHRNARDSAKVFECSSCLQYSATFENVLRPIVGGNLRSPRRSSRTTFSCQFMFCGKPIDGLSGSYECFRCDKMCETAEFLKNHEEIHSGPMPFPCNICGKCFGKVVDLLTHIRKQHNETTLSLEMFACKICKKSYQGGLSAERRILRTYPSRKQTKNVALPAIDVPEKSDKIEPAVISSEIPLIRLDEVMNLAGITSDAEMSDYEENDIVLEIEKSADDTSPLEKSNFDFLKCSECNQQFNGYRKLNKHLNSHQPKDLTRNKLKEPAGCPFCKKSYKFIFTLQKHIDKCHPESQIFVCRLCAKIFETQDSLKSHSQACH